MKDFTIKVATDNDVALADTICIEYQESAKARGTGIAKRTPEYVATKMKEGKAIIAYHIDGRWAGFCYIETWSHGEYVAHSGLLVNPEFRKYGLGTSIKEKVFELSRKKYPTAKVFGITTSLAVMKINSDLGYRPVTFSELTSDEEFWMNCKSCPNYDILTKNERRMCLCTGMLYVPETKWVQFKNSIKKVVEYAFNLILL